MAKAIAPPPPPGFELEGVPEPPPGFVVEAPKAKSRGEEMFADIQRTRGMDKPQTKGALEKAYDFIGGRTGIGATGAGILGTMLAPETGGLSILIPALAAGAGGAAGAATEGKNPLTEGLREGVTQGAFGGAIKAAPMVYQGAKDMAVKMFGGRAGVSEAAEGLFRKWFLPPVKAKNLWRQVDNMTAPVKTTDTVKVLDDVIKQELKAAPTTIRDEILDATRPLREHFREPPPSIPSSVAAQQAAQAAQPRPKIVMGNPQGIKGGPPLTTPISPASLPATPAPTLTGKSLPVDELARESIRFRKLASQAYKKGDIDLGNSYNRIRAALLDDLEKGGAPQVKEAARATRREMAIEQLAEHISKPVPGVKLRDLVRKDKLFATAFNPTERAQIDRIVKKLEYVAPSANAGVFGKIATAGLGALIGHGLGSELLGMGGGFLGAEYARTLLSSPAGRDFMEKTLEGAYKMAPNKVALIAPTLATFARGLMAGQPPEEQ